jgi:hypothetical protein
MKRINIFVSVKAQRCSWKAAPGLPVLTLQKGSFEFDVGSAFA